jgi:repressor LexA
VKELTPRQKEVLDYLRWFVEEHKYPPTIREIAAHFEISVKGAHDHIKALERKNHIRSDLNRSRAIEILSDDPDSPGVDEEDGFMRIPVLGRVAAGTPLFAAENLDGYLQIHTNELKPGQYFALTVQGDSMQGAGILDGDTGVFLHKSVAENGDIVVALLDEEAVTLKRFFKEKNRIKLKAENPVYPPIYTQNIRVLGKLKRIIRHYE